VLRPCLATNTLELGSQRSIIWLPSCGDGGRVSRTRLLGWSGTSRNSSLLWAFLRPRVVNLFLRGTAVPFLLPPAPGVHVRLLALVQAHGNVMYPGNGLGVTSEPAPRLLSSLLSFLWVLLRSIWCMLSINWIRSGFSGFSSVSNNRFAVPSLWMPGRRSDMSVLNDVILFSFGSFVSGVWLEFFLAYTYTHTSSFLGSSVSLSLFFTGPIFSRFPGSVAFLDNGYWVLLFLSPRYRDSIWC
jgi:hypothetical protein